MIRTVCKIKKGKKFFYARIDMNLSEGEYMGLQCYKESGEYIYTKWNIAPTI